MAAKHDIPVDVGFGGSVTLTASQLKSVHTLVSELQKMKKGYDAVFKVKQELRKITDIEQSSEKKLSRWNVDKRKALLKINDLYKIQNTKKKENINLFDLLRKRESWELFYFTAINSALGFATANSKIMGHAFDVVGSALGFILDMLLIPMIPYLVQLVDFLFNIGEAVNGLPEPFRTVLGIITLIGLGLMLLFGKAILTGLADIALQILGIGTKAVISEAAVASLTTGLTLLGAGLAGLAIGVIVAKLLEMSGALQAVSDAGKDFRASAAGKAVRESLPGQILKGYAGFLKSVAGINYDLRTEEERAAGVPATATAQSGGTVGKTGFAVVHQGEQITPAGGGNTYNVTVNAMSPNPRDIAQAVQDALRLSERRMSVQGAPT